MGGDNLNLVKELTGTNPLPNVLPQLGLLRVKMQDGSVKEFRGTRAERRRFIRQNHLQRIIG